MKDKKQAKTKTIKYPSMRMQKRPSGKHDAYVTLSGKRVFLGRWGKPETEKRYLQEIYQWLACDKCVLPAKIPDITVVECAVRYLDYCRTYYASSPKSSLDRVRQAMVDLCNLYGRLEISNFSGIHLRALREMLIHKRCH